MGKKDEEFEGLREEGRVRDPFWSGLEAEGWHGMLWRVPGNPGLADSANPLVFVNSQGLASCGHEFLHQSDTYVSLGVSVQSLSLSQL